MSRRLRIGDLTLDTDRRVLLRSTDPIPLGPLTYRLLLALVECAPDPASHDELIKTVWDGRCASPETISQRVKLLRDSLSDDAQHPRYIELVRGHGYRLIPPVQAIPEEPREFRVAKPLVPVAIGLILVGLVAVLTWLRTVPPGTQPRKTSIAVLPFADMSPEGNQAYFADGVSEEILNLLADVPGLRVIARTSSFSFRGQNADIATIAKTLNVTHVLEGSVRKSEGRVRIAVQLADGATGVHLWSTSYDRELGDILAVQADIATSVAAQLKVNLLGDGAAEPSPVMPVDTEAFDRYLQGLQHVQTMTVASLIEAEKNFERSIRLEPEFVQAHYGLGLAYLYQVIHEVVPLRENLPRLREVVARGLALAPENAGLVGLQGQLARYEGKPELAEQLLQRALELDPSDVSVRILYGVLKLDQSDPGAALETHQRSLEIDPLNPLVHINMGFSHLDLANTQEALAAATRVRQLLPPGNLTGLEMLTCMRMLLLGDIASGIEILESEYDSLSRSDQWATAIQLIFFYYALEDVEKGDAWLATIRATAPDSPFVRVLEAYRLLLFEGTYGPARSSALDWISNRAEITRADDHEMHLAVDALIERGESKRAVALMLELAPVWARYREESIIAAREFSPAPAPVKSGYSSYPASLFPDFIRALRAAGDRVGADNMLGHLETILRWRRERGLFVDQLHVAEARALRGDWNAALDALEQAERERTIYYRWQGRLLFNSAFDAIRDDPRFMALIERVRADMHRQRARLRASHTEFDPYIDVEDPGK